MLNTILPGNYVYFFVILQKDYECYVLAAFRFCSSTDFPKR